MNDLIERIYKTLENGYSSLGNYSALSIWELLSDCRAEIQRLLLANETLKGLCDEYQAQIKAQGEYVPMTDDELLKLHTSKSAVSRELMYDSRWVEAEVIKRAGLVVKEKE